MVGRQHALRSSQEMPLPAFNVDLDEIHVQAKIGHEEVEGQHLHGLGDLSARGLVADAAHAGQPIAAYAGLLDRGVKGQGSGLIGKPFGVDHNIAEPVGAQSDLQDRARVAARLERVDDTRGADHVREQLGELSRVRADVNHGSALGDVRSEQGDEFLMVLLSAGHGNVAELVEFLAQVRGHRSRLTASPSPGQPRA